MPTCTQRIIKMTAACENGPLSQILPGTETTYPNRTERRRLARVARHESRLKIARFMRGGV